MTDRTAGESYLGKGWGLLDWLTTTDHKRVAWLYLFTILGFFLIGGAAATLIRIELFTAKGDLVRPETYNRLFTLHGVIMVWFFLIPSIPNTLGNFLLPLMIGARDLAFPRLNLLSWYIFLFAGIWTFAALILGGVDTGWTFYTPLSSLSNSWVSIAAMGVFFAGFSTIASALNFVVTIHKLRCPGMTWFRMPIFVWTLYATSLVMLLATPVLAATLLLIVLERVLGLGVFDPAQGGDPILFQHLFWFYSHPAVYIMILPGMGVVSEILPCFAKRPLFGYRLVAYSSMGIATFSFLVWGHHMFVSGQSVYAGILFSFMSYCVAVPSAIKVFNWTFTLRNGYITFEAPMLYALGFLFLFGMGGLTGLMLAATAVDVHVTDTYFIVAHFHYIMVGGAVSAFMGGLHFWWPKMTGRMYPERLGQTAAMLSFIGFFLTFAPQFVLGYQGMPRRYYEYPSEFQTWHALSSAGAVVLAASYLMPLFYLTWSVFRGRRAGGNPWQATGLEWQTASPPPAHNFDDAPVCDQPPYAYPPPPVQPDGGQPDRGQP
ncbi:cytochrome c oxidase subunit I [Paracoccus jeotgali]|uniref:cytochrome c oxidase subunit I n=1 Tax=Paracoccus jeotgali TaxID=2065379 RepID=UPI0028A842BD|nr:cytochrome c oxidase subunit I [Paracoccus jeotgali]